VGFLFAQNSVNHFTNLQFTRPRRTFPIGMSDLAITPITHPFTGAITPPGSKSMTNRALILAALAAGRSTLTNILLADDTKVMLEALEQLGFELDVNESTTPQSSVERTAKSPSPPPGSPAEIPAQQFDSSPLSAPSAEANTFSTA
jgi:hypothetical protein